jgi:hypothetical protein
MNHNPAYGALGGLSRLSGAENGRFSSWDRSGKNYDYMLIDPGQTVELAWMEGAGKITHIWMTTSCKEVFHLRKCILEMYWDDEKEPSVQVPLGDFFGIGHAMVRRFWSIPLTMSPEDGKALNCYFPMPYAKGARVVLRSELTSMPLRLYYYIDYEKYKSLDADQAYFHAQWRRENPAVATHQRELPDLGNLDGKDNYVILDAKGRGHYVGCSLNIDNAQGGWYGEGDDMFFIDGDKWPPRLHGTGTEDYFNTAWCPTEAFCTPYFGMPVAPHHNWEGKISLYRFHIEDPVHFQRSLLFSIEHGHANSRADDISSVAYWYQVEPHKKFPKMPPMSQRLPNVYRHHPYVKEERTTIPDNEYPNVRW